MIFNNFPKLVAFCDYYTTIMKKFTILSIIGVFTFNCSFSQLLSFNFNAEPYVIASFSDARLIPSSLQLSTGTIETNSSTGTYFTDEPYIEETGGWGSTSMAQAKYFYLTIQALPGYQFTCTEILLDAYATSSGPSALTLLFDTLELETLSLPNSSLVSVSQTIPEMEAQTSITLKIAAWSNGSRETTGSGTLRIDNLIINGLVTELPPMDSTSTLSAGNLVIPNIVSSLMAGDSLLKIMELQLTDSASGDGQPTLIDSIFFKANTYNQFPDWRTVIDCAQISSADGTIKLTGEVLAQSIRFIPENQIIISEGPQNCRLLSLFISLKAPLDSADGKHLGIFTDAQQIFCNPSGSQIHSGIVTTIPDNLQIEVLGTQLNAQFPDGVVFKDSLFTIKLSVCDALGSIDLDWDSSVIISALADAGELQSSGALNRNFNQGMVTFNDLKFTATDTVLLSIQADMLELAYHALLVGYPFFSDNFEHSLQTHWINKQEWEQSQLDPIKGTYSLKHAVANPDGLSYISAPHLRQGVNNGRSVWRMVLRNGDFDPTTSNRFWYFLMAQDSNLISPGNAGYAVGVNYTGSNDSLSLWRLDASGSKHLLIQSALNWEANDTVAIEVVRDVPGTWHLGFARGVEFSDLTYTSFVLDTFFCDLPYHGLLFQYSTTRAGLLWADDISFFQLNTSPVLLAAQGISNTVIELVFSEALHPDFIVDLSHYQVSSTVLNSVPIDSAVFNPEYPNKVQLFVNALRTDTYQLSVSGLADWEGASSSLQKKQFSYRVPAVRGDVVINEVLFDSYPVVALPDYDYIEIYNQAQDPFYLGNWKLEIDGTVRVLPDTIINPNEYVIITSSAALEWYSAYGKSLSAITTTLLTNTGKPIKLISSEGKLIDSIFYQPAWITDENKQDGGWSLERIDPQNLCGASGNWTASLNENGGTPGTLNSVYAHNTDTLAPKLQQAKLLANNQIAVTFSEEIMLEVFQPNKYFNFSIDSLKVDSLFVETGKHTVLAYLNQPVPQDTLFELSLSNLADLCGNMIVDTAISFIHHVPEACDVIINELMADPNPLVGLPPTIYIELYNRSPWPVHLDKWKLEYGTWYREISDYVLPGNSYLILCPVGTAADFESYGPVLDVLSSTTLTSTGKLLQLKDTTGMLIDAVDYRKSWYRDAEKEEGGWSLERIDPNNLCSTASNWKASESNSGGTPGAVNSVFASNPDTLAPAVQYINVLDPYRLYLEFSEPIPEAVLNDKNHYVLHGTLLSVLSVTNEPTAVVLELPHALIPGNNYTLKVWQLSDLCGNPMNDTLIPFIFNDIEPYDVVISELMIDETPSVGLPEYEYIELYNRSTKKIQLENWELELAGKIKTLPRFELHPRTYLILCHEKAALELSPFGDIVAIEGFVSLPNTSATIQLRDTLKQPISELTYNTSWYNDEEKDTGGWSLEVIDPNNTCSGKVNWKASVNPRGGTPGTTNSVNAVHIDTQAPRLMHAFAVSEHKVSLNFSEQIPEFALLDRNHFNLSGFGKPDYLQIDSLDAFSVHLEFSEAFEPQKTYELTIKDLFDNCGNVMKDTAVAFTYYSPALYDVVFNEIFASPTPSAGLPEAEFLELYNRSGHDIYANNWKLTVGNSTRQLPFFKFPAQAYVILTRLENAPLLSSYGQVLEVENLPLLPASGSVSLLRHTGEFITSTHWSSDWFSSAFKANGGYSLERIDENCPDESASNWHETEAVNGGTPGERNSVYRPNPDQTPPDLLRAFPINDSLIRITFSEPMDWNTFSLEAFEVNKEPDLFKTLIFTAPNLTSVDAVLNKSLQQGVEYQLNLHQTLSDLSGNNLHLNSTRFALAQKAQPNDVLINEVLYNPFSGGTDFVELYNRSSKVINLKQFYLASRDNAYNIQQVRNITDDGALLFPDDYVVLSVDKNKVRSHYYSPDVQAFYDMSSLPGYPNDAGVVVLIDTSAVLIDEFAYTDKMQFGLLSSTKGVSLERIDPNRPASEKTNWHSAAENVGWATPGYRNSVFKNTPDFSEQIQVEPEAFSPDNDGYNDMVNLHYSFTRAGFMANVLIFDKAGRKIRTLASNHLLAQSGIISWDGLTDKLQKAPVGIYIIYFELIDLDGTTKQFRKVCVVSARL
jgi:hypothetical protein